ncbi:unnamed protein product [Rangifer tarandus platyrhynchus]|uniref:Uncharacterized protein n=3 Tax=Rangifer tarandus platyrhynchus TaxID=3082113 RepID=A0ACB0EYE2_RANTA|nr:unnamed protein product [Rangifer tarandus platyrhynchus]CAI9705770.1 unnamed protein product [Rangifer tarandus platyrhynchus]
MRALTGPRGTEGARKEASRPDGTPPGGSRARRLRAPLGGSAGHTRGRRSRRSGRKSGLAPPRTEPRSRPAAPVSGPPTCKTAPLPTLTPPRHSQPPLRLQLLSPVPDRTCRTPAAPLHPPPKIFPAAALPPFHLSPATQAGPLAKGPFPA